MLYVPMRRLQSYAKQALAGLQGVAVQRGALCHLERGPAFGFLPFMEQVTQHLRDIVFDSPSPNCNVEYMFSLVATSI